MACQENASHSPCWDSHPLFKLRIAVPLALTPHFTISLEYIIPLLALFHCYLNDTRSRSLLQVAWPHIPARPDAVRFENVFLDRYFHSKSPLPSSYTLSAAIVVSYIHPGRASKRENSSPFSTGTRWGSGFTAERRAVPSHFQRIA